jgi:DNA-binding SARP family transcriptional activator/tetratricopeptide (TPR) repeat protein/TolB-like protein
MIRLSILGSLELRGADGHEIGSVLAQPKRLALLVYLAVATPRGFHRRDRLLGLFWPESDEEHARAALRQAVRYLRRSLGAGVVVNRGEEELGLAEGALACDAVEFVSALAARDAAAALRLYRGDLLESFFVAGAPDFERWLEEERAALKRQAIAAAWAESDAGAEAGDAAAAIELARRALALDPTDERGVCRLAALLDRSGDRSGALRALEAFAERLSAEYGLEPSPETATLIAAIRERGGASGEASQAESPGTPARRAPAGPPPSHPVAPGAVDEAPLPGPPKREERGAGTDRTARPPVGRVPALPLPLMAAGAVLVLVVLIAAYFAPRGEAGAALEPRRVVVAPFENRTGDAGLDVLGSMTADWLIQGLAQAGFGEVVPVTAALVSTRYVAALPDLRDSFARARELARETGAGVVVTGSYYREADSLHFQARIMDAAGGQVLHALRAGVATSASPLDAIDLLRARVLAALAPVGDGRESHARFAMAPPTYEAYADYVNGMEAFVRQDLETALRHFERSASQDTTYPMPVLAYAIARSNLGDWAATDSLVRRLEGSRDRLGPFERGVLDMVQGWLRGDDAAAYEASVRQAMIAPGSIGHYQVAEQARRLNRPREALRVLAELGPERGELRGWQPYWRELAFAHHMLGDHERELREARRARQLYPDQPAMLLLEVRALAALGRLRELNACIEERLVSPSTGAPSAGELMVAAAAELRAHGHHAGVSGVLARAVEWYESRPPEERARPGIRMELARAHYLAERWADAEALIAALAAEFPHAVEVQGYVGLLAARRGDRAEVARVDHWLETLERPYLAGAETLMRARIAAVSGESERAVALLRESLSQGRTYGPFYHTDPDLALLRGDPAFRALMRPKG